MGNLHVHVFSTYETMIMTISKFNLILFNVQVQASVQKVCSAFSSVHISFSKNLFYPAYAEFQFFN